MSGVVRIFGPLAAFARASARYWLWVFPAVARELRRRRELALEIPDPTLRRLALEALEAKRCNLEGAAAFGLLAPRASGSSLMRTLTAYQAMCDYLDLLAEQPTSNPVLNGACLHQALTVALTPVQAHRDYYAHHSHQDDGGYLQTLVEDVQAGLAELPGLARVQVSLARCAERIAAYQTFNHGDVYGSYELFERWASAQMSRDSDLFWWELGGGAGSTLTAYALIACAADEHADDSTAQAIERAYFPSIGALHSLLDSLVDQPEDLLTGERGLIGCYPTPEAAGERLYAIAREALERAGQLPDGRRHRLLVKSMIGFYLCEARRLQSAHARATVPRLLSVVGALGRVAMWMMCVRHAMRRPSHADQAVEPEELDRGGVAERLARSLRIELDVCVSDELETCASADGVCGE
jgi:tetraprenyl-beta-curcumene synthase